MPDPINVSAARVDLSTRIAVSTTVAASPAAGTETVIATITGLNFPSIVQQVGVIVQGWCAFTVGTNGVTAQLRIYDTSAATGELIADTGVTTQAVTATKLTTASVAGLDVEGDQTAYCLTLTIGSGSAASTVSAVQLLVIAV